MESILIVRWEAVAAKRAIFALAVHQMITDHRVYRYSAQELAASFGNTEKQNRHRDADCAVDAILNGRKHGNDDTNKEDDRVEGRNSPELVNGVWRRDEIANGVDDNTGEGRLGDIVENLREGIDGQKHHNGGNTTSQWCSNASLRLDGRSGE